MSSAARFAFSEVLWATKYFGVVILLGPRREFFRLVHI